MIRPFTCICMLLAAGSGLYLYQTKHRAQLLDREIARTFKQIDQAHDRINALKAEWALLNEPDRLKELADQHTGLRTLATTQFVAINDLPSHLPAPMPPGTPATPPDDAPASLPVIGAVPSSASAVVATSIVKPAHFAANDKPAATNPVAPTSAAPATDKPAQPVSVTDKPAQPANIAHAAAGKSSPLTQTAAATAAPLPSPRPLASPPPHFLAPVVAVSAGQIGAAPATAPGTIGESVLRAGRVRAQMASTSPAPTYTSPTYTAPAYTTPAYITPAYHPSAYAQPAYAQPSYASSSPATSALGSSAHTALPPPVPFGAAQPGG